jgi:hypothetical protein
MDKVWIVQQGCYSDRHIVRVFATEGEANAFVEKRNKNADGWDECDVEWWAVGEAGYYTGTKYVAQWSEKSGECQWSYEVDEPLEDMVVEVGSGGSLGHWVSVAGYDQDRVLKALRDRATQLKAELAGIA